MIEQINIALEQKGQEFLSLGPLKCRRRLTSEKAYTSIKSDEENEHPAFFPSDRTIL